MLLLIMRKKPFQKVIKNLLISITMILIFSHWLSFGQYSAALGNLISGLDKVDTRKSDKQSFEEAIGSFCDAMSSINIEWSFNANESLFLYYICNYVKKTNNFKKQWFKENPANSYIKFEEDNEWRQINTLTRNLPDFYKDTEEYTKKLFDKIIWSYVSIYQAAIYWYVKDPNKSDFTEYFSIKYFSFGNDFINICANDKPYSYPKTCKKIKDYFYWARNLINTNDDNILNDENIFKEYQTSSCLSNKNNLIPCWLYWWGMEKFVWLIYNELMFYSIFVEYYSYLLQNKSHFKNRNEKSFDKQIINNQNRVSELYDNIQTSKEAIQISIKMLKELQYTFPIHIWFLMYSEDIYKFNWSIVKLLTPIDVLQHTFRNVQKKD